MPGDRENSPTIDTAVSKQINIKVNLVSLNNFVNVAINSIEKGHEEYAPGANAVVLRVLSRLLPKAGLKLV
jgi:hypothetical protein